MPESTKIINSTKSHISEILNEIYASSSIEEPKSILFVHQDDDGVKKNIKKWADDNNHSFVKYTPWFFSQLDENGYLVRPWRFDTQPIEGAEIVYQEHITGYANEEDFKNYVHQATQNLLDQKETVVDSELRLAIVTVLPPRLCNNPIYGEADYSKFDEVVLLSYSEQEWLEDRHQRYDNLRNQTN